mmetsp:Transcript_19949/g.28670  ORF Transcript_19949/g.28670 Transcript_19949/m.28670 type:complete len:218 (-) Transcript_19949:343-996(-)
MRKANPRPVQVKVVPVHVRPTHNSDHHHHNNRDHDPQHRQEYDSEAHLGAQRTIASSSVQKYAAITGAHNKLENHMDDIAQYESYTRKRAIVCLVAWLLPLVGIFFILLGRAESEAFQGQPRLIWLEVLGYLLVFVPPIWWCVYICCPGEETNKFRREISLKRQTREDEYETADRIQKQLELRHKRERQEKEKQLALRQQKLMASAAYDYTKANGRY